MKQCASVKFVIIHNHFRPGGVRRVIEMATPYLVRILRPRVDQVVLAAGEAPDGPWLDRFRAGLGAVPVVCRLEPALGYVAEKRQTPVVREHRLHGFFEKLFGAMRTEDCVAWAHNQGLGRNPALTRELTRACSRRSIPLVLHHHDWWFDNRWHRWSEMRRAGFRTITQVAETFLPSLPHVRHAAINQADTAILQRHFHQRAGWLPNLADAAPNPAAAQVRQAGRWLTEQLGEAAPVWLAPCRLLRRKNLAEALLLTRWLRPEAWLVTTGGISSAEEQTYARRLGTAARQAGWRLRLGLLSGDENSKPSVPALLAASEAVLLTSLFEGFGLPYIEAAAAHRPLLARSLPNIAPDLARFGFRFPQYYEELLVDPGLFDWSAEHQRQRRLFRVWQEQLPSACRRIAGRPALLEAKGAISPVPFSRLTLTAQLEVLRQPLATSWSLCAPLNPFLAEWRARAARGTLGVTPWPRQAARWLGGAAYAARFTALLSARPTDRLNPAASLAAQREFIRQKLCAANLYPLTWCRNS
ncbi:MAG: glycosyltransferase [Opitutaceae bacterium]|nr:glycosyltransferase [Opitutaceae bacterium]